MARRAGSKSPRKKPAATPAVTRNGGFAGFLLSAGASLAVLASWFAFDPRSIDAFEAPKALLAEIGITLAAGAALWSRLRRSHPLRIGPGRWRRCILALFAAGLLGALLSSIASPRPADSLRTLQTSSLFLLALGVGASLASSNRFPWITFLFTAGAAVNAVIVLLTAFGLYSPIAVTEQTQRTGLGALLGNPGYLGLSLALAAVALLPRALSGKWRWPARAAAALVVAGIFATQTLSGLAAFGGGAVVYLILRFRRRAAIPILAAAALMVVGIAGSRQLRFRVFRGIYHARQGDWNAALSARAAPWLAGVEMVRAKPWLGIGPGNFASEFIPRRIQAEARHHQNLTVMGMATNSFSEAHSDYLEILAAVGIPSGVFLISAFALVLIRAFSLGRRDSEAAAEASSLAAGAIAAATWFPFQIAASGVWLLLLLGAAFHRLEGAQDRLGP
ncbi:MAG: O-antigen ligase family protein [Thermoanaerobaculia bacterium]